MTTEVKKLPLDTRNHVAFPQSKEFLCILIKFTVTRRSFVGLGRVNQLGGSYINGKALSNEIRQKIIAMASRGVRPCEISRRLQITHGCISKLLTKYRKTGSIQPGGVGVGRPRVITCHIAQRIYQYLTEQPRIHSREIQARLVQDNICSPENSPSLTSISRLLKKKERRESVFAEGVSQPSNKHSIDSILNHSSTSGTSSSSSASSLNGDMGETNDQQQTGLYKI